MKIGITKRELLNDYYPDELPVIFAEYGKLGAEREEEVFADDIW